VRDFLNWAVLDHAVVEIAGAMLKANPGGYTFRVVGGVWGKSLLEPSLRRYAHDRVRTRTLVNPLALCGWPY
jgi:hypothetical protein